MTWPARKILITGSSGHLGEALVRTLKQQGHGTVGLDIVASPQTDWVGSITDAGTVARAMQGVDAVLHTATLHKPHVATHSRQQFVDTNISGTLTLLEAALREGVQAFVFTSTTSVYGDALVPPPGQPAAWITEDVVPVPKNIYGATKAAAEDLCQLFHRHHGLPCLVLRTSRFSPEADDLAERRDAFDDDNLKVIELLYRRADIHDIVTAHLCAMARAPALGFGKFIVSATTPFERGDLARLRTDPSAVLRERVPAFEPVFQRLGWRMLDAFDRVYVNQRARDGLGWRPEHSFASAIQALQQGQDWRSPLARSIPTKGYHPGRQDGGIYPLLAG